MGQQCVRDTCQRDDRSTELAFNTHHNTSVSNSNTGIPNPAAYAPAPGNLTMPSMFNTNNPQLFRNPPNLGQPPPPGSLGLSPSGQPQQNLNFQNLEMGLTPGAKPSLITPNATVDIFVSKDELGRRQGYGRIEELGYLYEGHFRDDYKEGEGTLTWPDGRHYQGQFLGGKFHGKAVMVWADGRKYDGDYVYGRKHGYGIFLWPDGRRYIGEWYDGRRHGKGTYTNAKKETRTGWWENDKPQAWDNEMCSQLPTVRTDYGA